jgi:signal transduction histidine kinase
LETLTNDLLELSRLETKSIEVTHEPLELNDLLNKVGEIYASQAEQKGLAFTLKLPADPLTIYSNELQLQRALGNLLDNALKFTPQGGAIEVSLQPLAEMAWVEIWVEDDGIGVPADELPQIFSRFHRGRNATHFPGSGLGLAITKAIVESQGGQVTAQGCSQGARFIVRLPVMRN